MRDQLQRFSFCQYIICAILTAYDTDHRDVLYDSVESESIKLQK